VWQVPAAAEPASSEVALELAQHDLAAMAETRADALSEVLSVSSVEENADETRETSMEADEVAYELAESTVRRKQPTLVGVAEDHQSEEEEEEIFLEVTEPSVPGQEVTVEMAAADVRTRPATRAVELHGKGELAQVRQTFSTSLSNTCLYFRPFRRVSALRLLVGRQEGHPACKN